MARNLMDRAHGARNGRPGILEGREIVGSGEHGGGLVHEDGVGRAVAAHIPDEGPALGQDESRLMPQGVGIGFGDG